MRLFLLALALFCAPGTAFAQKADSTVALQQVGVWAQQLVAAQQPAIDAYQRCAPLIRRVGEVMRSDDAGRAAAARALIPSMQTCMTDMRVAVTTARDGIARMGPLPKSVEDALHVDTRAVLRQTVVALDGMVASLRVQEEMLIAAAAGDFPLALKKAKEGQALAGSAIEGQIVTLQTMRAAMPMETHKAMLDIRIATMKAMREIVVCDADADRGELSIKLHQLGIEARAAAVRLRANWKRESAEMRNLIANMDDPARTHMLAALDDAFAVIASLGDEAADLLGRLPEGRLNPADTLNILDRLASYEVRIVGAIRAIADAVGKVS